MKEDLRMLTVPCRIEAKEPVTIVMVFTNQKEILEKEGFINIDGLLEILPSVNRSKEFKKIVEHHSILMCDKTGIELSNRLK